MLVLFAVGVSGLAATLNLAGRIPDCPPTVWNSEDIDLAALKTAPPLKPLLEWEGPLENVMPKLLEHGCIWFKGIAKDEGEFRAFYEELGLDPCLDPIHTSGLRAFASAPDAIYEEVNKPSLSQHYIGLHQESTHKKTAKYGAFVCFQPATVQGGEFLIADAAKILRELDTDVARRFYEKKIRISVSNLDMDFLPRFLMETARTLIDRLVAPKFDMDLDMIYGADGKPMRLQAVEKVASPINRHPDTGEPLWFCNVHNHARYLRDRRPCNVPEVGMTDVYYGDLSHIPPADLDHINQVSESNIHHIPMQPGDVLLCDNYRILHGRDIFKGDRYHAVTWFRGMKGENPEVTQDAKPGNFLNKAINKFLVDSF